MLLDSLLVLYVFLIILSIGRKNEKNHDYLSIEVTAEVRGIAATGIILHHLSEKTHGGVFFSRLPMVGYLIVTLFFFLSGYGLMIQYMKKGKTYLKSFLRKRVLYIVIVYLLDVALYAIVGNLMGEGHTLGSVIKSIFVSGVAKNAWYMIVQIIYYIFFYIVFRYSKINSITIQMLEVFVLQTVFAGYCIVMKASSIWYLSGYGFVLGILWANYKSEIDRKLVNCYNQTISAAVGLFVLFYAVPVFADHLVCVDQARIIRTVCRLASSPLCVCVLMITIYKYRPNIRLWRWLGRISLEVYLIHGLVYSILRSNVIYVSNDFVWAVLTIICSVLLAIPMNKLNTGIAKMLRD